MRETRVSRDETHRPTVRTRASPLVVVASSRASPRVVASSRVDVSAAPRGRSVARSVGRATVGRTRAETVGAYAWVVTRGDGGGTHTRVYSGDRMDVDKRMRDVARRISVVMLVMLVMEDSGTEYGCSCRSEGVCARDASDGDGDAVGRRRRRRRARERERRARARRETVVDGDARGRGETGHGRWEETHGELHGEGGPEKGAQGEERDDEIGGVEVRDEKSGASIDCNSSSGISGGCAS